MTDFTQEEKQLAQWLWVEIHKNQRISIIPDWNYVNESRKYAWLLTAQALQKKQYADMMRITKGKRFVCNYHMNLGAANICTCLKDKLKSHFLKGEQK